MATLPPRRNPTPTKISKQHLTPLQILLQMGFPKHRAEKALAATGHRGVQLASDWLLAHVNDPLLDDSSPRDYILYACPTGQFLQQLQNFWEKSLRLCGWNGAHNYIPHITLVSFFKVPDEDALQLAQGLKSIMDRHGAILNEPLKLETYTSPNFMGFFVAEEHADYLKRIAMQYVKEVSNATISVEPHVKSLHLSLAYQFPSSQYSNLKSLVDELDPQMSCDWEIRLYSRDPRINSKQVHKVVHTYSPTESDELDLRSGDYVYISSEALSNSPDGWVEGTSWLTGLSGLLPESYTQRTAETDAWTLHKKISLNSSGESKHPQQKSAQPQMANNKDHSVFNNHEIKGQTLSPDYDSWVAEAEEKARSEGEENLYENLLAINKKRSEDQEMKGADQQRNVFIMRHAERIDFTFGSWLPFCYDEAGNYIQRDLNLPQTIPSRKEGPKGYLRDSPLTNIGIFTASMIGEAIREKNISIDSVYCSPSFRCIQTCDSFLQAMNKKNQLKIKIEPGLFEWLVWYPESLPDWLTADELIKAGYNIDENYQPFVNEKELREAKETCEQFYLRSAVVSRGALSASTGNVLLIGHSATLETCSHELIGRKPRSATEMTKIIQKIPYCGLIQLTSTDGKWEIVEPPTLPLTYSANQRFDWKILLN
ncbi:hypothetical protein NQ315_009551 [Exocentrus adspersus]|uniref:Ecdysteroid-phosphate phosphatase n=1 Tax=Exocentrus adspersus TaxID=1586481 RepID=A0AAV8WGD9_9CUCU|nr:hypothetical protein NQ315_009551 [Exocentrus adspersus]